MSDGSRKDYVFFEPCRGRTCSYQVQLLTASRSPFAQPSESFCIWSASHAGTEAEKFLGVLDLSTLGFGGTPATADFLHWAQAARRMPAYIF